MSDYEVFRASQPGKSSFDPGPTIQAIDADLADVTVATLERYSRDLDLEQVRAKPWEALPTEQRRALRSGNELARRERVKEQDAAKAAEAARVEALHNGRLEARIAAYKSQARGAFPGNDAQFEAAWPSILQQYQIDSMRAEMDSNLVAARARMGGF